MIFRVNVNYQAFDIKDHNTALSFAMLSKESFVRNDLEKEGKVTIELLSDEEAENE